MIKQSIILISISSIAKAVCDKIKFHDGGKWLTSDFWLAKNNFSWDNRNLFEKYVFSFTADGWHLFDTIRIVALLVIVSLLLVELSFKKPMVSDDLPDNNKGWAVALTLFLAYCLHGIVFEITFKLL